MLNATRDVVFEAMCQMYGGKFGTPADTVKVSIPKVVCLALSKGFEEAAEKRRQSDPNLALLYSIVGLECADAVTRSNVSRGDANLTLPRSVFAFLAEWLEGSLRYCKDPAPESVETLQRLQNARDGKGKSWWKVW